MSEHVNGMSEHSEAERCRASEWSERMKVGSDCVAPVKNAIVTCRRHHIGHKYTEVWKKSLSLEERCQIN